MRSNMQNTSGEGTSRTLKIPGIAFRAFRTVAVSVGRIVYRTVALFVFLLVIVPVGIAMRSTRA